MSAIGDWFYRFSTSAGMGGVAALGAAGWAYFTAMKRMRYDRDVDKKTHDLAVKTSVTDRYMRAIEQLADDSPTIQIGGIYALEQIAEESQEHRSAILAVLCHFVRSDKAVRLVPLAPGDEVDSYSVIDGQNYRDRPSYDPAPDPSEARGVAARVITRGRGLWESKEIDLREANLRHLFLERSKLAGADLRGADLFNAKLRSSDLSGAQVNGFTTTINQATLSHCKLSGLQGQGTDFSSTTLMGADLSRADLSSADLSCTNLRDADLTGARLWDTELFDAEMSEAQREYAKQEGAKVAPPLG